MPFPFVRLSRYITLSLFCLKEQRRAQDAEYQVARLLADNETLGRLVMHYKKRADRLEYALYHPRKRDGQFSKIIPITQGE